jgi:cephalosporin-C deacetylase-like acetyl esterase
MFLGDIQAAWYLVKRPDWDGKTFVVTGGSQGGMQSYVVAGLDPQVTAMLAMVPAGCDDSGALVGRRVAWPFYMNNPQDPNQAQVIKTSAYFDPMNFAPKIKCPVLVGLGLIDQTATPSGTLAAFNQIPGANKEVVILPKSDHMGTNHSQAPYYARFGEWAKALKSGNPAPVQPTVAP